MPADWVQAAQRIADEIRERRHDQSLALSLADLLARSGADAEPDGYRSGSYWAATQRGDPDWRTFRDAGLVLGFDPDETGREVERVTFRLDRMRE